MKHIGVGSSSHSGVVWLLVSGLLAACAMVLVCAPSKGLPAMTQESQEIRRSQSEYDRSSEMIEGNGGAMSPEVDIFVDGQIERRTISKADGNEIACYVLKRSASATFAMHYHACGHHILYVKTDTVVLWPQPGDESDSDNSKFANMLWDGLVGSHVSVRGELDIKRQDGEDVVYLLHALPSDNGVVKRQFGVPVLLLGIEGCADNVHGGYNWDEVSRIADVMALSGSDVYGDAIANLYDIHIGSKTNIRLADGSVREVEVTDMMTETGDGLVGLTFEQADNRGLLRFGLGGVGEGLPVNANNEWTYPE